MARARHPGSGDHPGTLRTRAGRRGAQESGGRRLLTESEEQRRRDAEQLRLLSIFHYVVGALALAWALFPLIHLGFGVWMVLHPDLFDAKGTGSSAMVGWVMIAFAAVWMALGLALAAALLLAGRALARRRRYVFCLVVAGITAVLCVPFGTVLGVLTIIVLVRPSVKAQFEGRAAIDVPVSS